MCTPLQACTVCGTSKTHPPNYQKQVDPPARSYGTLLGESPKQKRSHGAHGGSTFTAPLQICIPAFPVPPQQPPACQPQQQQCHPPQQQQSYRQLQQPNQYQQPHQHRQQSGQQRAVQVCSNPRISYEPCPPPPPTKIWLIKSSPQPPKVNQLLWFLLSFAIAQPPPCQRYNSKGIFVPCQPPL